MGKKLNLLTAGGDLPLADCGLKFTKMMLIENIELHEKFKNLYVIDSDVLKRIVAAMKLNGFDKSQPVHIWQTLDSNQKTHWYLIDGYTRVKACGLAGITQIPVYEHSFKSFEEAYKYVLGLQVNRRNLDSSELLRNVSLLLETDFVQNFEGNKAELISDELGISKRTVQKAIVLEKKADEKLLESVRQGDVSVNKAYEQIKKINCYKNKNELIKVVFYVLSKIKEGLEPEVLVSDREFLKMFENQTKFEIPQDSMEKVKSLGYEKYLKGEL